MESKGENSKIWRQNLRSLLLPFLEGFQEREGGLYIRRRERDKLFFALAPIRLVRTIFSLLGLAPRFESASDESNSLGDEFVGEGTLKPCQPEYGFPVHYRAFVDSFVAAL